MKPINSLYDIAWNSRILIEASAGTGKTYTLAALYVRLLLEKELDVDQILVMTFTKKATAELKGRIFKRLKECQKVLEGDTHPDDAFLKEFARNVTDKNTAGQRIRSAIQNFDDSQVYTIHGFCQKILKEEALLAGTPFDFEIVRQDELLTQAAEDFWRNFMSRYSSSEAGRYYLSKLMDIADSPAKLRDQLSLFFDKPYAAFEGEGMDHPLDYLKEVLSVRNRMAGLWNTDHAEIEHELYHCDLKLYTERNVASRIKRMKEFLDNSYYSGDTFQQFIYFTSRHVHNPENLKSGKTRMPNHSFFDICDQYFELIRDIDKVKTTLIREAVTEIAQIRERLSISSSTLTYNDLLTNVKKALMHAGHREEFAEILRRKYPAALVDEFQDTDPIQYNILNAIYPSQKTDSFLLMIGDPKQAIYAFRGADVYTYLKAKESSDITSYTLHKNFRSAPGFNRAVNTLFGHSTQPFIEKKIEYFEVDTGRKELESNFLMDEQPASGLKIITKSGIDTNKPDAEEFVYSQTVWEILSLLKKAGKGNVRIGDRGLEAGDIAVLVSSHKHAEEIKRRLKKAGVDSVTYSQQKVFESPEARRLESVMKAIIDPYNRSAVNNALVSGFWGQDLNEIYELSGEGDGRQDLIEELQELNETWSGDGFYPMFRKLLFDENRISKLSRFSNSERLLTNLYQLADISVRAEMEGGLDPHSLYSWLVSEMADPDKDEEKTLLLESDQNLVKISTIHNSKGLEFPVVFCPTLWDVKSGNNRRLLTEYHAPNGDPVIRYDQQSNEENERAENLSNAENIAEDVRKYYVALTRAKYLCVIPWANHRDSLRSGMIMSLIDSQSVMDIIENKLKLDSASDYNDQMVLNMFGKLAEKSGRTIKIEVDNSPEEGAGTVQKRWKSPTKPELKIYTGRTTLEVQNRMESFSSLTSHTAEPGEPDYDQVMESYISAVHLQKEKATERSIFTFPRGATAGTAIHKLFEHEDFKFQSALTDDHTHFIEEILEQYQIDPAWSTVVQKMIRNIVSADVPGLELKNVGKEEELREMEFHLSARRTSLENILDIIRGNGNVRPDKNQFQSFLTGFIDLVVRQNGKYYILDYKSNYLGDAVGDYSSERLEEEIYSASYDVQYHLYTAALIKYLKSGIPGFDYESDFGGVAYLFVRGMQKGEKSGIWFHKPEKGVIQKLVNELEVQL